MFKNKLLILFLIFVIIFFSYINSKKIESFINNLDFSIKDSEILEKGERGLFARKNYKKGDIIENCPTLKMGRNDLPNKNNILHHHFFKAHDLNYSLVSLGYCSIINHSNDKQNCTWRVSKDDNNIIMYAIKDIKKGEELYSNYGDNYWSNKNYDEK
jgi:SET domain-containing protein